MWEAIRANTRRSRFLIGLMGFILVGLGYLVGAVYGGPQAGAWGAGGALGVWLVLLITALGAGERVLMLGARARRVEKEDVPRLWNIVEEMTIASGLGTPPKIYVIDDDVPNAFAAGRKPESSCVAVTSGLLKRLNRDELQGVIAHEIGHVRNHDVRFMTIAGVMLGSVVIISDIFLRSLWYGGGRRSGGGRGGGQGQLILVAAAIAVAILAPVFTRLLYYACSRGREYLADASAARFTPLPSGPGLGAGEDLARHRVSQEHAARAGPHVHHQPAPGDRLVAAVLHSSPDRQAHGHPALDGGQRGLEGLRGRLPRGRWWQGVPGCAHLLLRAERCGASASGGAGSEDGCGRARQRGHRSARPDGGLRGDRVSMRRAHQGSSWAPSSIDPLHPLRAPARHPEAESGGASAESDRSMQYRRTSEGWESFQCVCGHSLQLSPAFQGRRLECPHCKRSIAIVSAQS